MKNLFGKLTGSDGAKKYQIGAQNDSVFSIDKQYSLVEVITLLKYQAYINWGSDEALEILLTIASIRECLLNDAKLQRITDTATLMKEMRNVSVDLGKVLRNFELLCEQYSLSNPLTNLEGAESVEEMKKLVKLDADFYAKEDAVVITEEIYRKKSKELGADFLTDDEIYPLANIQLYDTMLLLMLKVVQYDSKAITNQITECLFKLRRLVADRKALDLKFKNSNNQCTAKEIAMIEDLSLQMGEIKAFFDGVADESTIPNKLYYEMNARDFWEKLANMFEVLNTAPVVSDSKNSKNNTKNIKKETSNNEVKVEKVENTSQK